MASEAGDVVRDAVKDTWQSLLQSRSRGGQEPLTPEQVEFNQLYKRELDYIGKNKESLRMIERWTIWNRGIGREFLKLKNIWNIMA